MQILISENKMPKQVYYTVRIKRLFYSGDCQHNYYLVVCDLVAVNLYMSVLWMNCELNVFLKK